jgi:hypothetical protein
VDYCVPLWRRFNAKFSLTGSGTCRETAKIC